MKEKEWQKFMAQSVALLATVLIISFFFMEDIIKDSDTNGTAAAKNMETVQALNAIPAYETSVLTDEAHVKERSSTYIKIPKSAVTTGAAVYMTSDYMDSSIRIVINGKKNNVFTTENIIRYNNGKKYAGKTKPGNKNDILSKLNISASMLKNKKYRININIKTRQLYEPVLYETSSAYYISLALPRDIYDKIIVVDAGHGGIDEGTMSPDGKYYEKDYTLLILHELKDILDNSDIKAYYTRLEDIRVSKPDRIALANKLKADLLISIHCNASDAGDYISHGVEALYSNQRPTGSKLSNKKLAETIMENVADNVQNRKRGVIRRERLYLLHHSDIPATIIEIGYMSNKSDLKYIKKKSGQKKIAKGIYNGIMEALE